MIASIIQKSKQATILCILMLLTSPSLMANRTVAINISGSGDPGISIAYNEIVTFDVSGGTSPYELANNGAGCSLVTKDETSLTVVGAIPNELCTIIMEDNGAESRSFNITVTKANPVITFTTPSTLTYDNSIPLGASSTNTITPITFAASGGCRVDDGNQLKATSGTGTCTVTASQALSTNYNADSTTAAPAIDLELATPTALTVSSNAPNNSLVVGETATLSTSGGSDDGSVSYQLAETGACDIDGSTLTAVSEGTCSVTATKGADDNYDVATSSNTLTINISNAVSSDPLAIVLAHSELKLGYHTTLTTTGGNGNGSVTVVSDNAYCEVEGTNGTWTVFATQVGPCTLTATKAANGSHQPQSVSINLQVIGPATPPLLSKAKMFINEVTIENLS